MKKRLQAWLKAQKKLDGFLISKPENIYALTGFWGSFGLVVVPIFGPLTLITDGRYTESARELGVRVVELNAEFKTHFGETLSGTFACEDSITLAEKKRYQNYFPNIKWRPKSAQLETFRRVKTTAEIATIAAAQSHVDKVLIPFLESNLRRGVSEQGLNFKLQQVLQAEGQYGLSFPSIIAFGSNSSRPHHVSGSRTLRSGDNILIDCGVVKDHYCSDMTRNFIFGDVDPAYLAKYESLLTAQQQASQRIKAGASTKAIDAFCREILGTEAEFFTHSLGHGVGLEIHELPTLSTRKDYTLEAGEVVTNEPGLYYPDQFGIRIEDLLVVTKDQPRILSQTTKDLLSFDENGGVKTILKSE